MRPLLLSLALLCSSISAQAFDAQRSRFLSSPNGRTGTYAPFRVVLTDMKGADTVTLFSDAPGVTLERQVATAGKDEVSVVIPVMVGQEARLRVTDAAGTETNTLTPTLPLRRIEPDYARPYVAVFSSDPVYARVLVPTAPRTSVCDYFELAEFFTDWRLLDGYDSIVIINPNEVRLPPGSQRTIAEFCSLGGSALVIGSFRLGEKDVDVPAPGEPEFLIARDVSAQRFAYGPGAIYRVPFDQLQRSQMAADVVIDVLRDHLWFGADQAPGGTPQSRIAPPRAPFPPPLPAEDVSPTPLFWGLAGGVLLLCLLTPLIGARLTKRTWPTQLAVLAGCAGLGGLAMTQTRPLPVVEVTALVRTGDGEAASNRVFVLGQHEGGDTLTIRLNDANDNRLVRRLTAGPGWTAWVIDTPRAPSPEVRAEGNTLVGGMVGDEIFRDFGTRARRGDTNFSTSEGHTLDWWLEQNAYRGRKAVLKPLKWEFAGEGFAGVRVVTRGAISVTDERQGG